MRARFLLILVAVLLVAGFAAINWAEFNRPTTINFGWRVVEGPLGLLMLGLLGIALLGFLVLSAAQSSYYGAESRRLMRDLQAQRELADKAESSRFTELRQHIDTHLRDNRQRDAIAGSEFEKSVVQGQRELRTQLEQMNRMLGTRLTEFENHLDSRLGRAGDVRPPDVRPTDTQAPRPLVDGVTEERARLTEAENRLDAALSGRPDFADQTPMPVARADGEPPKHRQEPVVDRVKGFFRR